MPENVINLDFDPEIVEVKPQITHEQTEDYKNIKLNQPLPFENAPE